MNRADRIGTTLCSFVFDIIHLAKVIDVQVHNRKDWLQKARTKRGKSVGKVTNILSSLYMSKVKP